MTFEHLIAVVAIGSTVVAPLRLSAVRGVDRSARLVLLAAVVAYASAGVWAVVAYPVLILPLVVAVALGWLVTSWRGRPDFGVRRGYPRGSLGLGSSIRALTDYEFYRRQAARFGPVFKTNQYYRPVLCIVGLEQCQRFLAAHRRSLTSAPLPINRLISGGLLRYMEADQHRRYRRYLAEAMAPAVVAQAQAPIATAVRAELEKLSSASRRSERGASPFAAIDRLVCAGLLGLFFDLELHSERANRIVELFRVIDHRRILHRPARDRSAIDEIVSLVLDQAADLGPVSDKSPRSFLAEALRLDSDRLSDRIFIENLTYFFHIARSDLDGLCAWLLKMLCDHHEWAEGMRRPKSISDDEASRQRSDTDLADRFVRETLRLRQSEYLYRTVSEPIAFERFSVPSGWLVRLCVRESHVDPKVFDRPLEFNPDRFVDATFSQQQYQPFGIYEHACMGAGVTATLGRVLVLELAGRYHCATVQDGPMELGLHHHDHWRPSSRWRVRLDSVGSDPALRGGDD